MRFLTFLAMVGALLLPLPAATAASPRECTSAMLAASWVDRDAAMSHWYGDLRLTNVSTRTCWVQGYGGLSFVGHGNGTQIGQAAARTPSKIRRVVLAPGQVAASRVEQTSPDPYPKKRCHRTEVDGFRVYVPDSRVAKFVAHPTVTCANKKLTMLEHKAYRKVRAAAPTPG